MHCSNIPGYFSQIPSKIGYGTDDDVEYVEFDANDNHGWVTVPESSGWGLPSLPGLPSGLPSIPGNIVKAQVRKYLSNVKSYYNLNVFRRVWVSGLSMLTVDWQQADKSDT